MDDITDISVKSLLEHADIGVVIHRWDTSIVYASPAALRLLGLTYAQLLGKDSLDTGWHFIDDTNRRLHPDEYPVGKVKRFGVELRNELVGVVASGREVSWFTVNAYPEGHQGDDQGFVVVIFNEVTTDKRNFSFRDIVENADDVIIVTEAADIEAPMGPRIVYVNQAFERLTGYTAAEVIGETPRLLQGSLTSPEARARIHEHLRRRTPVREKLLDYGKDGTPYWLDMNIVPLTNRFGEVTHFAAIERNVSEQIFHAEQLENRHQDLKQLKENLSALVDQRTQELREANMQLERLAYVDALTQIPNRRAFVSQAEQQFARAARHELCLAVGVVDLDRFKDVNDQLGHAAGDQALVAIAACLLRFFRQEDVFGRIGGEEFAFCIVLTEQADAALIGERLREAIAATAVSWSGHVIHVTASIGLCVLQPKQSNVLEGLREADSAMYRAKSQGRNRVVLALV
ncbi:MAG: diguanylate cyclase [Microbacteriaceae bacterium]|nr:diguanylate cyclase [Burkholderiaceae bacterium]